MTYQILELQEKDDSDICVLYKKVFNQPMCEFNSSEIYSWFYFENLYEKNYSRGLYNGESFLSYWGFIPVDCKVNGNLPKIIKS